jgi:hypothetical protein
MFTERSLSPRRVTQRHAVAMKRIGVLLAWAVCLGASSALACTGPDPIPVEERFKQAKAVAIVRVKSVSVSATGRPYIEGHADIIENLKGTREAVMPVRGYLPGVNCWAPIDVGREYVVFLPMAPGSDEAWFSMFGNTLPLTDVSDVLLRKWRTSK